MAGSSVRTRVDNRASSTAKVEDHNDNEGANCFGVVTRCCNGVSFFSFWLLVRHTSCGGPGGIGPCTREKRPGSANRHISLSEMTTKHKNINNNIIGENHHHQKHKIIPSVDKLSSSNQNQNQNTSKQRALPNFPSIDLPHENIKKTQSISPFLSAAALDVVDKRRELAISRIRFVGSRARRGRQNGSFFVGSCARHSRQYQNLPNQKHQKSIKKNIRRQPCKTW